MGKTTSYPGYSGGSVSINGENKASTTKNGNNVNTNYNMSSTEKAIYDYAQNSFLSSLPNMNVFSQDTRQNMQNQIDAFTNKGQKLINNMYTPMLNDLKTDIGARFGNFDNSVFMDNLNSIETKRADSVNAFAQDIMSKQNELVNDELAKRYQYMSFLSDIQNGTTNNIMNYINSAMQNSGNGNSYNNSAYTNNYNAMNNLYAQLMDSNNSRKGPSISDITSLLKFL